MSYNPSNQNKLVSTKSAAYTAQTAQNEVIEVTCSTAAISVTLPVSVAGRTYDIKKMDATAFAVTITPTSGTIDGQASLSIGSQYQSFTLISDGTNYQVV